MQHRSPVPTDAGPIDRSPELAEAIERTGYYPAVVRSGVVSALAGEPVVSFLVHHEPTIDRDEVRRHLTVAVLTSTRLILAHTDEYSGDDLLPAPYTSTSTEAVRLSAVTSVAVTRMVANPEHVRDAVPPASEAVLTLGWGGVKRVDMEPAGCADPQCEADHGYSGLLSPDDFSLRVSAAADGQQAVDALLSFADELAALTQ